MRPLNSTSAAKTRGVGSPPAASTSGRHQEGDASTVDCAVPLCLKFVGADHRVRPFGKVRFLRVGDSRSREPIGDQPRGRGARILACRVAIRGDIESRGYYPAKPGKDSSGQAPRLGKAISARIFNLVFDIPTFQRP